MAVATLEKQILFQRIHFKGLNACCFKCQEKQQPITTKKVFYFTQENCNRIFFCEECATKMLSNQEARLEDITKGISPEYLAIVKKLQLFNPRNPDYLAELEARMCQILLLIEKSDDVSIHVLYSLYNSRYGFVSKDQMRNYLKKLTAAKLIKTEKNNGRITYKKLAFN